MFKKFLVLLMVVLISVSILSIGSFGAFNGYAMRFNSQEYIEKFNLTNTEIELKDGYVTVTSTAHDPNIEYTFSETDVLDADKYKFAVMKYRTTYQQEGMIGEFYFASDVSGYNHPATHAIFNLNSSGEWQRVVVDFSTFEAWTGNIKSLRIDYIEANNLPAGAAMDIEYIAFFETREEAEAFNDNFDDNPPTYDQSVLFAFVALLGFAAVVFKRKLAY
ncbi:MAG: hypothetical protein GX166_07530 [Clostridiaceae bacterium]|jgi:hypothetical protein|nr:hypothetical protein [Clostridiaceae bacterium]